MPDNLSEDIPKRKMSGMLAKRKEEIHKQPSPPSNWQKKRRMKAWR